MSTPDVVIGDNGFLPGGVKVSGKREFADLLRRVARRERGEDTSRRLRW